MGSEINPEVYVEYEGVKVYFCCWGCDDKFLAEPEKYIPKLPESVQQRIRAAEAAASPVDAAAGEIAQTTCPVMGGEIDPTVYTDYHGVRVYFCCPPCIETFEADPQEYIPELPPAVQQRIVRATAEEADGD
jgi:YHS domain-containing protein